MYAVLVLVFTLLAAVAAEEEYTSKFDNVNVHEILHNNRLLANYINCVLGKGKCTPDGQELKGVIPDALATDCAKCSEKQKKGAETVLKYLYENKQDVFKQLEEKFDPEGKYRKKNKKLAEQKGIKV